MRVLCARPGPDDDALLELAAHLREAQQRIQCRILGGEPVAAVVADERQRLRDAAERAIAEATTVRVCAERV
ncbi:MAG: hypothetical protein ACOY5V_06085 [Pseudomonadota bacterium]